MEEYITVLIVTYNDGEYIFQAVQSILQQTFRHFELLIIDDGSTDSTEQIISKFCDPRIRYIKIPHKGFAYALNYGLRCAKNNWIARMDADDISHPERLEIQLRYLSEKNRLHRINHIVCSFAAYFIKNKVHFITESPIENSFFKKGFSLHSYICHSSVIFNKNHILGNGGYNEKLSRFEDYDLWLRILNKSEFIIVPEVLLFIRIKQNSLSNWNKISTRKIIYDIQTPFYNNFNAHFGINDSVEIKKTKGWREYFYGEKKRARLEWNNINLFEWDYRMLIAYIMTYLNDKNLNYFREKRIRLRIKYLFLTLLKSENNQNIRLMEIINNCKEISVFLNEYSSPST